MITGTSPRAMRPATGTDLPSLEDLDVEVLAGAMHPVLAAVAVSLLPRALRGGPAMAFYEDGPYQL